jgi:hypothetical protein
MTEHLIFRPIYYLTSVYRNFGRGKKPKNAIKQFISDLVNLRNLFINISLQTENGLFYGYALF